MKRAQGLYALGLEGFVRGLWGLRTAWGRARRADKVEGKAFINSEGFRVGSICRVYMYIGLSTFRIRQVYRVWGKH